MGAGATPETAAPAARRVFEIVEGELLIVIKLLGIGTGPQAPTWLLPAAQVPDLL
jgi:hypothetical protein